MSGWSSGTPLGGAAALARCSLIRPDRVVGDFRRVAAADQHLPGTVALTIALRGVRVALLQQQDRRAQLGIAAAGGDHLLDQMRRDPTPLEVARDPLAPPLVELALVLGELAGIAGVV